MDSERWERIKALYQRALDVAEAERKGFVERESGDDAELADEVLKLLDASTNSDDPIDAIVSEAKAAEANIEGQRLGPYRLLRSIGRGGMGDVYLAERADEEFEQQVAIKVVSWARLSPGLVERFKQERQILANLDHPNVARLYDGGTTEDGVPYLVMEYVDGQSIVDVATDLSVPERLELFLKICDAVQYAHSKLVVHRDLKPSNVLVTKDGTPKLLDFGIAKFLDEDAGSGLTRADARILTPEYASPEQVMGMPVTIATDVYGLGLMLYQVLTGELPFDANTKTSPELRDLICNTEPDAPSKMARAHGHGGLASKLEGDLDNIVLTALRKEPERRYETVRDLANDLQRHLERRPVLARAPSLPYRAGRFVSRNRVGVAATTAAIAAALSMTVFYTTRLQQERDLAETERQTAEAATDFMVDLFSINDPDKGAARDITAREVLDEGAKKLDEGLEDQPRVRARLLQTVGRVYERIGDYDNAQRFLEEGVTLRRTVVDPLDEDLIRGIENLAWIYYRREDWDTAERYAKEALEKWEAKVGKNDPALSDVLNHLGTIAYWKDDMETALGHYHRALSLVQGDEEEIVKDRLVTMNNLAITYDWIGKNKEAQEFYLESLNTRIKLYGPDHPRVGTAHANLGSSYANSQNWQKAKEHAEQALEIDRKHLGDIHADVAFDLSLLASAERGLKNFEKGAEYARQSADIWAATVGKQHTRYASALDKQAEILRMGGRFDEALEPAMEALEVMLNANGPDHTYTADPHYTLANILMGLDRLEEAKRHGVEASRIREAALGRQHSAYWNSELILARIEIQEGSTGTARERLQRLIEIIQGSGRPQDRALDTAEELLVLVTNR